MTKKIVILYSGGLDSMMMEAYAKWKHPDAEIKCVFFDHGQESVVSEIEALPEHVGIRYVDWLSDDVKAVAKHSDPFAGAIYIPGRNLVFGAIAACQYLPDEVWMGTLADEANEQATDKNQIFLDKLNDTLKYVLSPFKEDVRVVFPFVDQGWTKSDALRFLLEKNLVSTEDIRKTTSCWHNISGVPCGECKQCFKRALILDQFEIEEKHASRYHPLDMDSEFGQNLMRQYLDCENPNADEREVQRLIRAFLQSPEA